MMTVFTAPWWSRQYSHKRLALVLLCIAALAFALQRSWLPFLYIPTYTPKTMIAVSTQRTSHCIGRYLIDLPSNFELLTGGWGDIELYYGLAKEFKTVYVTVEPKPYSNAAFWDKVNERRFALMEEQNLETEGPMLLHGEQINATTALLRRLPDRVSAGALKTEVHVLVGTRHVILEEESYSLDDNATTYLKADPAPAEARLKMIASKLLPYQNADRAKPGFCMQGVLFDAGQDDERATFRFTAPDMGDVEIQVDYHAVTGLPVKGLLQRHDEAVRDTPGFGAGSTVMKRGKTLLAGQSAEELLQHAYYMFRQHRYEIEQRPAEPSTLERPFFSVELSTGNQYFVPMEPEAAKKVTQNTLVYYVESSREMLHKPNHSTLSDEQVMRLWTEIIASVRKR
jgi:hypothetical protein